MSIKDFCHLTNDTNLKYLKNCFVLWLFIARLCPPVTRGSRLLFSIKGSEHMHRSITGALNVAAAFDRSSYI